MGPSTLHCLGLAHAEAVTLNPTACSKATCCRMFRRNLTRGLMGSPPPTSHDTRTQCYSFSSQQSLDSSDLDADAINTASINTVLLALPQSSAEPLLQTPTVPSHFPARAFSLTMAGRQSTNIAASDSNLERFGSYVRPKRILNTTPFPPDRNFYRENTNHVPHSPRTRGPELICFSVGPETVATPLAAGHEYRYSPQITPFQWRGAVIDIGSKCPCVERFTVCSEKE